MEIQIVNEYLRRLYEGKSIQGKPRFNNEVVTKFKKTVLKLKMAENLQEIRVQKGLNFEALRGNLKGFFSVRVDNQFRLILTLDQKEQIQLTEVIHVHELSNHYQ